MPPAGLVVVVFWLQVEDVLEVGLYRLNKVYPYLESAWFQPLSL
jgi:hypothetical protein